MYLEWELRFFPSDFSKYFKTLVGRFTRGTRLNQDLHKYPCFVCVVWGCLTLYHVTLNHLLSWPINCPRLLQQFLKNKRFVFHKYNTVLSETHIRISVSSSTSLNTIFDFISSIIICMFSDAISSLNTLYEYNFFNLCFYPINYSEDKFQNW